MFVTRAEVKSVKDNICSLSIPLLAGGKTNTTYSAPICSDPGVKPELKKGDLVIVAFEDNDYGKPMVIGRLFNSSSKAVGSGDFKSLVVSGESKLSSSTAIGDVTYDNLKSLVGYTGKLATDLADIKKSIGNIQTTELIDVKKLVLSGDMYGDSDKMKNMKPVAGQVFFLIGGSD